MPLPKVALKGNNILAVKLVKFGFFLFLIIVLYVLFSYARLTYILANAHNPDFKQQDAELGLGATLRYVAAGDSEVLGTGASTREQTYPYKVAEKLAETNHVVYKNIGVYGAKTQDFIDSQLPQIISFKPDIVTITIGANDQTHLRSNSVILKNYQTIINTLVEQTSAHIYVTNIPNFNGATLLPSLYIRLLEHKSKPLNTQLLKLSTDRVTVINIHDLALREFTDRKQAFSSDQFHLNDQGYTSWANVFSSVMR